MRGRARRPSRGLGSRWCLPVGFRFFTLMAVACLSVVAASAVVKRVGYGHWPYPPYDLFLPCLVDDGGDGVAGVGFADVEVGEFAFGDGVGETFDLEQAEQDGVAFGGA